MPIDSKHPLYEANIARWKRCRDAYDGEDAVKEAGNTYLPMLGGQDTKEYEAYKMRALYYEAVGRTIDGFVGAIARKPPTIKVPDSLNAVMEDVTADGVGILEFIKKVCGENMLTGRLGLLVDYDEAGSRCYLSTYSAESIINWDADRIVLQETAYIEGEDVYTKKAITQYRELLMVEGRYTVNIWRQSNSTDGKGNWKVAETKQPSKRGIGLTEIPFFWLSPFGGTARIEKPPLLGLINVALSHYRSSADLEHGRHFTGLPTLWVSGVSTDSAPVRVGATSAIKIPEPSGRVGYAEFTGQGLKSLENALESKEHMMAVLGAMVFDGGKKGVEAAETARIRTSGETSLLMGIVSSTEEVLEAALVFAAEWMGITGEVDVDINRDFVDVKMEPQELQQLVGALQAGAITLDTFLYNLEQAEMLRPDKTVEQEMTELARARKDNPPAADQQE